MLKKIAAEVGTLKNGPLHDELNIKYMRDRVSIWPGHGNGIQVHRSSIDDLILYLNICKSAMTHRVEVADMELWKYKGNSDNTTIGIIVPIDVQPGILDHVGFKILYLEYTGYYLVGDTIITHKDRVERFPAAAINEEEA